MDSGENKVLITKSSKSSASALNLFTIDDSPNEPALPSAVIGLNLDSNAALGSIEYYNIKMLLTRYILKEIHSGVCNRDAELNN